MVVIMMGVAGSGEDYGWEAAGIAVGLEVCRWG